MDLSAVKAESLGVALLDHRPSVVKGRRKPSLTGYMRSCAGIPYPMSTTTGCNFIDEIAINMTESLNRSNTKATKVSTNFKQDENTVKQNLFNSESEKKIFIVFRELHTDGYGIQFLYYDFDVSVFDNSNKTIAFKQFHEKRKLGGNAAITNGRYKEYMPKAIVKLFEDVLNDTAILDALNN
ncbi:hypothetical protein SAMN06265346_110110 [Flavobacterium hercynium]|uniref:Uncharacterized protein n=2 Tax=Flavobacterium hercynium TaxID=387094 RepID=A0A226GZP3_9FLAO|nr:hypothetical protein B0A66_16580 [Flavobacterium hercynium]SMP27415.1 hypothetical protein SAMN06265346_110110 [Flavobacterium hercynium]